MLLLSVSLACTPTSIDVPPDDVTIAPGSADSVSADSGDGPTVWISELMADNASTLADGDGAFPDWIELYNPGPDAVALAGWGLSDDLDDPFAWTFPERELLPGEYLIVFASGKSSLDGELHAPFALSADGESVALSRPDGSLTHALSFPAQPEDVSFGLSQSVDSVAAVADGSAARFAIEPADGWEEPGFDDGGWEQVSLGVGFDVGYADAPLGEAALFAETSQSSDGYGYTGEQAVDGELSSFSHTGDGDLEPWWQVDLGATHRIEQVTLYNRLDCCADRLYNLTVSVIGEDGGTAWASEALNPVTEGASPDSPGDSLAVSPEAIGRYVRVSKQAVNGAGSSEWLSLAEVEVTAALASPYAESIATDIGDLMWGVSAEGAVRAGFELGRDAPDRLTLSLDYDDGLAAWIDGVEVARLNPDVVPREAGGFETITLDPSLVAQAGVLALAGQNVSAADPDFLIRAELAAEWIATGGEAQFSEPTPGAPNGEGFVGFLQPPSADVERGFYDAPFTLTLTGPPGADLVYTLDGSAPTASSDGAAARADDEPAQVTLTVETTAIVRARALRDGYADSPVATWSYLFLDDVVRQPASPEGFPVTWDGMSQSAVAADYEMDPEIVDDPAYTDDLLAGLRDIPTMSIALDPADLFGDDDGIYVHSLQRGGEWERAASVELILADGSTGFQVDCGVRMHGYGWRYHSNTLKHSLRLEFSGDYGPKKLEYPLFPDAPVERFDSVVLRSQGSRGWQDFRDPEQAQYIRDAFARDTARDMGKVDGHATFVHLYLNGLYWGLYNPVERPDARFAEEYFGGDDADYDAINRRTTTNEAIDGDLVAYEEMLALADAGLASADAYAAIQEYLDVDDLIDYMLIHQYTVNMDGPEIYSHNNMRGIRERAEGAQFRFFVWDMEYSLWEADDDYNIDVDVEGSASRVYAALRENAEFRARYAERARIHLTDGGALTPEACLARWQARAEEIERAIVAESARWGDTDREPPYTRDVEWAAERERLTTEFFPYRTDHLIAQLTEAGLY